MGSDNIHIVAGVDGGATHTRVALADTNGRILEVGRSGPSNYGSVPKIKIEEHIYEVLSRLTGRLIFRTKTWRPFSWGWPAF